MLPRTNRLRDRIVDREVMKLQLREAKRKSSERQPGGDERPQRPANPTGTRRSG
jgi:hypothetical protein